MSFIERFFVGLFLSSFTAFVVFAFWVFTTYEGRIWKNTPTNMPKIQGVRTIDAHYATLRPTVE